MTRERNCPKTITRVVLVISDPKFFRDYVQDRGDEFVNDHPDAHIKHFPGRAVTSCEAHSNQFLNSWDRCNTVVTYWRIASAQALRGISAPVEVVWQENYRPRNMKEFPELLAIIEQTGTKT